MCEEKKTVAESDGWPELIEELKQTILDLEEGVEIAKLKREIRRLEAKVRQLRNKPDNSTTTIPRRPRLAYQPTGWTEEIIIESGTY